MIAKTYPAPISGVAIGDPDSTGAEYTLSGDTFTKLFGAAYDGDEAETARNHASYISTNLKATKSMATRIVNTSTDTYVTVAIQKEYEGPAFALVSSTDHAWLVGCTAVIIPPLSVYEDNISDDMYVFACAGTTGAALDSAVIVAYKVLGESV